MPWRNLIPGLLAVFVSWGCGGGGGPCSDGPSLTILDPMDGQTLTRADDVEPGGAVEYDVVVRHCGFEETDQIVLKVWEPVESDYGFAFADVNPFFFRAPLLPGTMRFSAQSMDGAVQSEQVTITATDL